MICPNCGSPEPVKYFKDTDSYRACCDVGYKASYPDGKLNADDQGQVAIKLAIHEGRVVMEFPHALRWFGMTKHDALAMGQALIKMARKLDNGK